jgi:hypothetical protein
LFSPGKNGIVTPKGTDMDDKLVIFFVVAVGLALFVTASFSACEGVGKCFETVGQRPCLPDTINYDFDDGECECLTKYGELEWNTFNGCDFD